MKNKILSINRTRLALALILAVFSCGSAIHAAPGGCGTSAFLTPFAFETISVSTTAVGFTAGTYTFGGITADMAIATLETDAVRYRDDGVDPTGAVGHVFAANTAVTVCGPQSIKNVRFIRVTGDASMSVSYYRQTN